MNENKNCEEYFVVSLPANTNGIVNLSPFGQLQQHCEFKTYTEAEMYIDDMLKYHNNTFQINKYFRKKK